MKNATHKAVNETLSCHEESRPERRKSARTRLSRIEGQVRGLQKMIDEDRYCIDILVQIKAVKAALKKVEGELLKDHVGHCLSDVLKGQDINERDVKINELVDLLTKQ